MYFSVPLMLVRHASSNQQLKKRVWSSGRAGGGVNSPDTLRPSPCSRHLSDQRQPYYLFGQHSQPYTSNAPIAVPDKSPNNSWLSDLSIANITPTAEPSNRINRNRQLRSIMRLTSFISSASLKSLSSSLKTPTNIRIKPKRLP